MSTTTANLGLTLPTPNVDSGWGGTLNTDFTLLDDIFTANGSGTSVGLQVGTGKTLNAGGTIVAGGTMILGSGDGTNTVAAPTIRGTARTGTNAAGANLTIDAANGTGTGGSGNIIFRTAPASTTGSTANTMATVMEIKKDGNVDIGGRTVNDFMPAGSVISYAGSAAPTGWLLCFGQLVSRSTYAALFAAISTTYGAGDGSTTFALPDLRGRAVAGKDNMGGSSANRLTGLSGGVDGDILGGSGGLETHTLIIAQMPLHGHPARISPTSQSSVSSDTTGGFLLNNNNDINYPAFTGTPNTPAGEQIGGTGGNNAHNNVQPTFILNYIIKT
jgi:microcystin-dependent protein